MRAINNVVILVALVGSGCDVLPKKVIPIPCSERTDCPDGGTGCCSDGGDVASGPDATPTDVHTGDAAPEVIRDLRPGDDMLVECERDEQCTTDVGKSFCIEKACVGCQAAGPQACTMRSATTPMCGPAGTCVECMRNSECSNPAKPICNRNVCVRCSSDSQCAMKGVGPGVCMAHQDGRCATADETVFVQQNAACTRTVTATAGTEAMPFCDLRTAFMVDITKKRLFLLRGPIQTSDWVLSGPGSAPEISIIGQQNAILAGGAYPGLVVDSVPLFVRDITVGPGIDVGIIAQNGATLRLDHVKVADNKKGGILANKASFDIKNTLITGNGPGQFSLAPWGGMLVNMPPAGSATRLELVSILNNKQVGVTCSAGIQGTGVLATGNIGGDLAATCGLTACSPKGPTCGSDLTP